MLGDHYYNFGNLSFFSSLCISSRIARQTKFTSNELQWLGLKIGNRFNSRSHGCRVRAWWRHQMETFSALLAICAGNSPVTSELTAQRPVTWSFDVFFDLRLNKRLSKKSWGWWFETPSCSYDVIVMWHALFILIICDVVDIFPKGPRLDLR